MGQERDNPKSKEDSRTIACIVSWHPHSPRVRVSASIFRITRLLARSAWVSCSLRVSTAPSLLFRRSVAAAFLAERTDNPWWKMGQGRNQAIPLTAFSKQSMLAKTIRPICNQKLVPRTSRLAASMELIFSAMWPTGGSW